jgi:hypothetical protein
MKMPDQEDLWGETFHRSDSAPLRLLEKQASLLTTKTGGQVQGVVKKDVSPEGTVWMSLYARVPNLANYEHKLISIAHPVTVRDPESPCPIVAVDTNVGDKVSFEDMARFREWLGKVLSSTDVHAVINNLMAYAVTEREAASTA